MAKTKISDIIVPSIFAPYALERTAILSEVVASGIIGRDPEFDALASSGGKTVDMPFWKDLTGNSEVLSDSGSLTVNPITTGQDIAIINRRGKAWGANDLAKHMSGDDPAGTIADLIGGWWARDHQDTLLAILDGLFDTAAGALKDTHRVNIYDDVAPGAIVDANRLTGETFIDATTKLGDAGKKLSAVCMHSDVEGFLRKRDLIDDVPDSAGKSLITMFQGRRVVIDDGCPKVAGTNSSAYTTYLFGPGAFAWGNNTGLPADEQIEFDRDALASDTHIVSRRHFILHPRGVKFTSDTVAGASPTNTEFETAANWAKVYTDKNIRIVAIRHNVTA